jgi:hypothetical protein
MRNEFMIEKGSIDGERNRSSSPDWNDTAAFLAVAVIVRVTLACHDTAAQMGRAAII